VFVAVLEQFFDGRLLGHGAVESRKIFEVAEFLGAERFHVPV